MRHAEVQWLLERLPESSAVVVYQHRPHRPWESLFADLAARLEYAPHVQAVYEANLAFLVLSRARGAVERLARAAIRYGEGRPGVRASAFGCGERGDQATGKPGETKPGRGIRDSA